MARKMCKCGNAQAVRQGGLCNRCFAEQGAPSVATQTFPVCELRLDQIEWNAGTQTRKRVDEATIRHYAEVMAEAMASGQPNPFRPLVVFHDGKKYWPADGFHRQLGARRNGIETFQCEIRQGGQRDALLFACGANADHGLRRTTEDLRHIIELMLNDPEWGLWVDAEIARRCNCSRPPVIKYRALLPEGHPAKTARRKFKTKHGTDAVMDTAGMSASLTCSAAGETCQDERDGSRADDLPDYNPDLAEHVHLDAYATTTIEPEPDREEAEPDRSTAATPTTGEQADRPVAREVVATKSDMPLLDERGNRIPSELRDLYGDTWIQSIQQGVDTLLAGLKAERIYQQVRSKCGLNRYMDPELVLAAADNAAKWLKEIADQLEHARLVALCPKCFGRNYKDCQECRHSGLMNKTRYHEFTGEEWQ